MPNPKSSYSISNGRQVLSWNGISTSLKFTNERALDELPYKRKDIETPGGHLYKGLELSAKICAVEIVRAGGAMRTSFSRIFGDAPVGKVLIQTSEVGEPLVPSPAPSKPI